MNTSHPECCREHEEMSVQMLDHILDSSHIDALSEVRYRCCINGNACLLLRCACLPFEHQINPSILFFVSPDFPAGREASERHEPVGAHTCPALRPSNPTCRPIPLPLFAAGREASEGHDPIGAQRSGVPPAPRPAGGHLTPLVRVVVRGVRPCLLLLCGALALQSVQDKGHHAQQLSQPAVAQTCYTRVCCSPAIVLGFTCMVAVDVRHCGQLPACTSPAVR